MHELNHSGGGAAVAVRAVPEREGILSALAVGLLARVAFITLYFHWATVPLSSDDASYVQIARTVVATGRLGTHHFPVGYPLFIASFLKLGDTTAFPLIRMCQVLFGLVTIVMVARIAGALYGRRAGLLGGWITALYPPLVWMAGRIMSETLFIALLMLSLEQFVRADREGSRGRTVLAGIIFAVASMVRSNLVLMLAFVPLWLLLRPRADLRTRLGTTTVTMAATVAVLMLPAVYFLRTKGEFLPFATNAGQTFYGANNPYADGGWVQVEWHPELLQSIPPEVRRSPAAYSKAQQALGIKWIREHPGAFLHLLPKKFANAWIPGMQTSETTTASPTASLVLMVVFGPLILAAIAGRILVRPAQRDGLLLAVLATYTVMSLVFYGNPRIGLFCAPVLIVYASSLITVSRFAGRVP